MADRLSCSGRLSASRTAAYFSPHLLKTNLIHPQDDEQLGEHERRPQSSMKRPAYCRGTIARSKSTEIQPGLDDFQWKIALPKAEAGVHGAKRAAGHSRMLHGNRKAI